ncbi:MAG: ribonuclease III [Rhodobacteraceae bacterium]|nr:ribonuclease III [Paracoccaceae bacterium]
MKLSAELVAFSTCIGHDFCRPELLLRAVTHSSISSPTRPSNERFEFLGDRVLGLSIATALFHADDKAAEGKLAPRFNALVRQETCAEVAREVGLGDVLKLGRSEMLSGGRRKEALLGDAMEALIAAVYLDAGFEVARDMVLRLWGSRIANAEANARDPKSALQEWAQARGLPQPTYLETDREGPDHKPIFTVEVRLKTGQSATGRASGKRAAEQIAARTLLARMEAEND